MQPQDRPVTTSPDVTRFLSPADPSDLVEEPEVELEPYVPYVPVLPPRPPQYSSRRKLSDEIDKFVPAEFGDGVDSLKTGSDSNASSESPDRENFSRPSQGPRERSNRDVSRERGASGRVNRNERRERQDSAGELRSAGGHAGSRPGPGEFERQEGSASVERTRASEGGHAADGDSSEKSSKGRRSRRRRGRNGSDFPNVAASQPENAEYTGDDEFGSGVDATSFGGSTARRDPSAGNRTTLDGPELPRQTTTESLSDLDDEANSENESAGDHESSDSAPSANARRRRNRRRGRRRGRGAEGAAENPAE